jgi:hypothetical protein
MSGVLRKFVLVGALSLFGCGESDKSADELKSDTLAVEEVVESPLGIHPVNEKAMENAPLEILKEENGASAQDVTAMATTAIIGNGTVQLGINQDASLNVPGGTLSTGSSGTTYVGLRYVPTGGEATAPGCLCEGWGVADATTGIKGWANQNFGGSFNLAIESFTSTGSTAKSVTRVGSSLRVTHDFKPSSTPNLYEVLVTIRNISADTFNDIRYTRAMDWDISPNTFSEYVTIQGTAGATKVKYANNNGFLSTDPLAARSPLGSGGVGDFVDLGPNDHGALFDFKFGSLAPGAEVKFRIFYGAAGTETAAYNALGAVRAEVFSFGQSNWSGTGDYRSPAGAPYGNYGKTTGAPHTFIFAFSGVGAPPINVPPTANAGPDQTLACLAPGATRAVSLDGSGSTDPEGAPLTYSWSRLGSTFSSAVKPTISLPIGSHTISLTVNDGRHTSAPDTVNVTLTGDVPPTLTLLGPASQTQECASPYTDPGARANDVCDGDLTSAIVRSGSVNPNVLGNYSLTYRVTDPQGQSATPVSRSVSVRDTQAPAVTVAGPLSVAVECGSSYTDPGATASDACAGALSVVATGTVNPTTPGNYSVSYSATDPSGNRGTSAVSRSVTVADNAPPVLALNGPAVQSLECGSPYADPGATANDACFGDLTGSIVRSGSVNSGAVGSYALAYNVTDGAGLSAPTVARTVNVADTLAPTVTILGPVDEYVECGSVYSDPGATANDVCAGALPVVATRSGSMSTPGTFTVSYSATDPSGNTGTSAVARTVTVGDNTPPVLVLNGAAVQSLECGSPYADPGATANDACYGDLTGAIVRAGAVNSGAPGSYTLTYSVTDASGQSAAPVSRSVSVADTLAPTLTLNGPASASLECGSPFVDPGASATDVCAGSLPVSISGSVNSGAPGSYSLTYSVVDPSGNSAAASRAVSVADTLAPAIALVGPASMGVECGSPFVDPGAVASDVCAGDLPVAVAGFVDTGAPGGYALAYRAVDPSGNSATTARNVMVADTLAPALALNGANPARLECGVSTYVEAGASATDVCAGDLSAAIAIDSSAVNAGAKGAYPVTYAVADPSGNTSAAVRNVLVEDSLAPTLALNGSAYMQIECGTGPYVEPGATATDACDGNLTGAIAIMGEVISGVPGTYTVGYSVADSSGHASAQFRTVEVVDSAAPVVTVKPTVQIWPPNHKYVAFHLSDCAAVTDQCEGVGNINASGTITSIFSDELEDAQGNGDGSTLEDIVITGSSSFQVRAERQGKGNGRVYGVNFAVVDSSGNSTSSTCYFAVPHDQSGSSAVNDGAGAGYTVTAAPALSSRQ